jgi:nicotinate-nucleotide pyrophosphorylase
MTMLQLDVRATSGRYSSPEVAMLEKKAASISGGSQDRAAIIACNAPGRH